ncbi:hypothetical protein [Flavobacterium poyangense]|uniref:hypothetical protein n=1 Tax=Flavobacterium poyangense TaxID=2204302 RepID=UPI0014232005|nr:hypothetical protein [Flavobacterium sp. JXAS1]
MKTKKSLNFIFLIVAIILGSTLYKQFDFEKLKFEHNGLAILYSIVFAFSIFILIKDYRNKPEK